MDCTESNGSQGRQDGTQKRSTSCLPATAVRSSRLASDSSAPGRTAEARYVWRRVYETGLGRMQRESQHNIPITGRPGEGLHLLQDPRLCGRGRLQNATLSKRHVASRRAADEGTSAPPPLGDNGAGKTSTQACSAGVVSQLPWRQAVSPRSMMR